MDDKRIAQAIDLLMCAEINCGNAAKSMPVSNPFLVIVRTQVQSAIKVLQGEEEEVLHGERE